jgi:hypothetical protein
MALQQHHPHRGLESAHRGERHRVGIIGLAFARFGKPGVEQGEGIGAHAPGSTRYPNKVSRNDSFAGTLNRLRNEEAMMAARAYWQGQIRLALVSIPVEIYTATKSGAQISFHQIHEPSGQRIKYEKVAPGVGAVEPDEIVKGFEVEKGEYVLLEQDEIDAVKLESKKTLELTQFVDADEIDVLYYERPYFVVPADDLAEEAFIVLREALEAHPQGGAGPAGDARAGICRQPEAVRARDGAGDAALCR